MGSYGGTERGGGLAVAGKRSGGARALPGRQRVRSYRAELVRPSPAHVRSDCAWMRKRQPWMALRKSAERRRGPPCRPQEGTAVGMSAKSAGLNDVVGEGRRHQG